jgi:hypothetical protein
MRTRIGWLAAVALGLAATTVHAQVDNYTYEVPPSTTPWLPLGHYRMEEGGIVLGVDFVYWRETNPMLSQPVAVRGFRDMDGSITGHPNTFVGSGTEALNTNQLAGPGTFTPGLNLVAGWRFENGMVLQASWQHLADVRYTAQATLIPPNFAVGPRLADTFLFSPVFNFPIEFAGEPQNVQLGNPGATFGIWNAAGFEQITYLQRFEEIDLTLRVPIWSTYCYRTYGLIGPSFVWIWDRFKWRTVSQDTGGLSVASDVADYNNIVSNRLYGVRLGGGHDWFLGDTPIGGFALSMEGEGGIYADFVKARADYLLETRAMTAHRNRLFEGICPAANGKIDFWWYPVEAVQFFIGYDAAVYFNTMAGRRPIDFDFSALTPGFDRWVVRFYHGIHAGFGITF